MLIQITSATLSETGFELLVFVLTSDVIIPFSVFVWQLCYYELGESFQGSGR